MNPTQETPRPTPTALESMICLQLDELIAIQKQQYKLLDRIERNVGCLTLMIVGGMLLSISIFLMSGI
ncbi:MAG: hypothetical protein Kow0047_22340 [Anaerolineae bacterium]